MFKHRRNAPDDRICGVLSAVWLGFAALTGPIAQAAPKATALLAVAPPSGLSYGVTSATVTRGLGMASLTPSSTGGAIDTYSVSPALPAGLALNPTTGVISGTPTATVAATAYTITASNPSGSASVTLTLTVKALAYAYPSITYTQGLGITANSPGSLGAPGVSFSVAPSLPSGLSLNATTGVISGTPSGVAAPTTYTVTATNAGGSTTTALTLGVKVLAYAYPSITYTKGLGITANGPGSLGSASVTFSVAPALPAGLSLNATTGVISGTPTGTSATVTRTVTATNAGGSTTTTVTFGVKALAYPFPTSTYTRGLGITPNILGSTGSTGVTFSVSPSLPAGLALNAANGTISGTPTVISAQATYTVTASNVGGSTTAPVSILVRNLLYITPSTTYTLGMAIVPNTVGSTGSSAVTFGISPALPAGLAFSTATGAISGLPTALSATRAYTVTATNAGGSATVGLSLGVKALAYTYPSITYTKGLVITPNTPVTAPPSAVTFSVAPALPAGLILNTKTGIISGKPTAVAPSSTYSVTASSSSGTATAPVTLAVKALAYGYPAITYTRGLGIVANSPGSLGATGVSFAVSPALPAGLTLNTTSGVISGTPTVTADAATFSLTATNAGGSATATVSLGVKALAYKYPVATYTQNVAIAANAPGSTGSAGVTFTVSPALPAGLALNAATGAITGTPTALQASTLHTVTATNTGGSTTATVDLTVIAPPTLTTQPASQLRSKGQTATFSVVASGAAPLSYQWQRNGVDLGGATSSDYTTAALTLADSGATFTVRVTDGLGNPVVSDTATLTVVLGRFTATGNISGARDSHIVQELADGRILVAGGYSAGGILSSARVYDPATHTFTVTGAMGTARYHQTATLLPDGKVLIAGGKGLGGAYPATAELYDPATGTFSPTGSMVAGRYLHKACPLPDGKVLILGGRNASGTLASAEVYDPATGLFSATGPLATGRYRHTATALADGKVLVAGGYSGTANLAVLEIYDPATGLFTSAGSLLLGRGDHTATRLASGHVLIAGGWSGAETATAELYDPATGTVAATGSLLAGRYHHTATRLASGKVLLTSGVTDTDVLVSSELFNPATGTFHATGHVITGRLGHRAALLSTGEVLVVAGYDGAANLDSCELFDPQEDAPAGLTYAPNPATYTRNVAITPNVPSSTGGVIASYAVSPALPSGLSLDPGTGILSGTPTALSATATYTVTGLNATGSTTAALSLTVNDPAPTGLSYTTSTARYTTGVAIATNAPSTSGGTPTAYAVSPALPVGLALDTATGLITGTPTAITAQALYTVTATNSGGTSATDLDLTVVPPAPTITVQPASLLRSKTQTATFSVTASGTGSLSYQWQKNGVDILGATSSSYTTPALAMADDGSPFRVSVRDAYGSSVFSQAAQLTVVQGKFVVTGSVSHARGLASATLLPDGKVLVAGGSGSSDFTATSELYDPSTGTFTSSGNLVTGRDEHQAVLLANGKVLIVGGRGVGGGALSSAELFDPATQTFSATGGLNTARSGHSATLLADGRVLVAGGTGSPGQRFNSAELYDPSTGVFTYTASPMSVLRERHSSTLLTSGLVLVTGGLGSSGGQASAETFDPSSGTWSTVGSMAIPRDRSKAIRLKDGKVLVLGGSTSRLGEVFDPLTGAFSTTGEMQTIQDTAGDCMTALAMLPDGSVLVVPGKGGAEGSFIRQSEIYDPATGTFRLSGTTTIVRYNHRAVPLLTGKVLVVGSSFPFMTTELFDPQDDAPAGLTYTTPTPTYTQGTAITANAPTSTGGAIASYSVSPALPAGLSLDPWTGVISGTPTVVSATATYTVTGLNATGSTTVALSLTVNDPAPTGLSYTTSTARYTTGVAITANAPSTSGGTPTAYAVSPALPSGLALDTATGLITGTPTAITAQALYTVTATNSGGTSATDLDLTVVPPAPVISAQPANATTAVGGTATFTVTASGTGTLSYQWQKNGVNLGGATSASYTTPVQAIEDRGATYRVVVFDAYGSQAASSGAALTVVHGVFRSTGSLTSGRIRHSATLLLNGKVLVAGGWDNVHYLSSAEVYEPSTATFSPTGSLNTGRYAHTATLLQNGNVLFAGGSISGGSSASAEVYDPSTGTFSTVGTLNASRAWHTATLLANGSVLITGGYNGSNLSSAELYDPINGTFTPTGSMNMARSGHTATLLPSGKVLVTGGYQPLGGYLTNSELFDPASGTFSSTGSLNIGRHYHTATLIGIDSVLLAGGHGNTGHLSSAELYDISTGTVTLLGTLNTERVHHTANSLANGKVVFIGGSSEAGVATTAELFEPIAGTFSLTGNPLQAREEQHTATHLPTGKLLIVGGYSNGFTTTAELFDPQDNAPAGLTYATPAPTYAKGTAITANAPSSTGGAIASYSVSPALPAGLSLDLWTGVISGTPTAVTGTSTFTVTGINATGTTTTTLSLTVTDAAPTGLSYTQASPTYVVGQAIAANAPASGGGAVVSYAVAPALPAGLSLDTATGIITGTPTGVSATATYTVTATNSGGTASTGLTLTVVDGPATPTITVAAFVTTGKTGLLATTPDQGAGVTYAWSLSGGTITAGQGTPAITYTAGAVGTLSVSVTATNAYLGTASDSTTAAVVQAPTASLFAQEKVLTGDVSIKASTPAVSGMTYLWTAGSGITLTGGASTNVVTFNAGDSVGPVQLQVNVQNQAGDSVTHTRTVQIVSGEFLKDPESMAPRTNAASAVLQDGRILVVGGARGGSALDSAELFDPLTQTWATVGSLATARQEHRATLLVDGRVLVTGGNGASGKVSAAEVFDPETRAWSSAGSLTNGRVDHSTTLMANGTVLVVGGASAGGRLSSVECYDPATNTWSARASLSAARDGHGATLLTASGRLLVVGGNNASGSQTASTELYDPGTNTWSAGASLTTARYAHAQLALPDGRVLVMGGYGGGVLSSTERYDPAANSWTALGNLNTGRLGHAAVVDQSGFVTVIGGWNGSACISSSEILMPSGSNWVSGNTLSVSRRNHVAQLLPTGGQIFVVGGQDTDGTALSSMEIIQGATRIVVPISQHTATILDDGNILVAGGLSNTNTYYANSHIFTPPQNSWLNLSETMNNFRYHHSATRLNNGKVLHVGGRPGWLSTTELYDPATKTWSSAGSLATGRIGHTATLLASGKVLIVGGLSSGGYLASTELYDPATNTWSSGASLATARQDHTATLLANGKVLVAGGADAGEPANAELYDPDTNSWSAAGSLSQARYGAVAERLASGKVLLAGGRGGGVVRNNAELYDPATNTWSSTGSLAVARYSFASTLLSDGRVLVVGGYGGSTQVALGEVFDPATQTWSSAGNMIGARTGHTLTTTSSGKVLVIGGAPNYFMEGWHP